ncbi:MAG: M14 family metallocarboxypeptidase [Clostridia bacterium]|nr:M14 family metallocarboxypeptidase [Clostridia bacterium]
MTVQPKEYDYAALRKVSRTLCEQYNFMKEIPLGNSCAGREIFGLRIGKGAEYALIAAAFHGSEYLSENVLLFFAEELCEALQTNISFAGMNVRRALFGRGVVLVPCVNPDGCEIAIHGRAACGQAAAFIEQLCRGDFKHWNANLRGVDINHNFDAGWEALHRLERKSGIFGPAPTRFGGSKPESEPETAALTKLCRTGRIRHAMALHTQGEVIYWTYGQNRPPRSERMAEILATSSGYALDVSMGLAEGGGFKDWFISELNRPAFTVEMGLGKNPLPIEDSRKIYERLREMLLLTAIM